MSIIEEICIITERHEIYISKSRAELQEFAFYKLKLLEDCDKIECLESGNNFLAFITDSERFFTNYRDSEDLSDYPEFHELERFGNFRITTFKCGLNYILLKGIPKLDAFGLNEHRIHKPLLNFTEDYGDGFSEASTESPLDNAGHQAKPFNAISTLHRGQIKFIENGVERSSNTEIDQYLGQPIQQKVNAKEETRRILMEERTPMKAYKRSPKVRIKTPLPKPTAFMDSSGSSTAESDHSVDDDLNRKVVPPETRMGNFFRRLKARAVEFEEGCKDTRNVISDGMIILL